jgi:hypothetical protein
VPMAFFKPVWASEMTSLTPSRPRVFSERRKLVQKASVSLSPTSKPRTSRRPVGGNTDRDDHGLGNDTVVDPRLAVRGVEEHVGVAGLAEVPVAERGHFPVQIRADPGHFGLRDAGVRAECFDEVVDLPGRDAVEVSLHNHGEQRLVHPAAPFEESGEERPLSQFGDLQIQVPSGRRQHPRAGAVALSGAVLGAFETAGADESGGLGVDEFLVERFGRDADAIRDMGELEFREEVKQGSLDSQNPRSATRGSPATHGRN